jgi:hypothetical protein
MTPYHFTHNNPVNRIDPDGRCDPITITIGGIALYELLVGAAVTTAVGVMVYNTASGGELWKDQLQTPGLEPTSIDNGGTETLPAGKIEPNMTAPATPDAIGVSGNITTPANPGVELPTVVNSEGSSIVKSKKDIPYGAMYKPRVNAKGETEYIIIGPAEVKGGSINDLFNIDEVETDKEEKVDEDKKDEG